MNRAITAAPCKVAAPEPTRHSMAWMFTKEEREKDAVKSAIVWQKAAALGANCGGGTTS